LPDWLAQVLESYSDPNVLMEGVRGLARRCGCSAEHLNRVVQARQGRRTTDLINALRLDWIAMRLRLSDEPITVISAACGLPNQANFYRLFQAAFGMTPAVWRRESRNPFPGNESQLVVPWRQQRNLPQRRSDNPQGT
jgi:AraC-like DNA-binding protein